MKYTEEEIKAILKFHSENTEQWVKDAREQNTTLKALITGDGFHEELIDRIEHLESADRALVRRKYSKDIRDLFSRTMIKRQNVFDANGGSENIKIDNDTIKELLHKRLSSFKSNKSLFDYLAEKYFQLADIDPNGVDMLEYEPIGDDFNLYPTYKSIQHIRYYEPKGQLVDYIVFEPEVNEELNLKTWRIVDDETDWTFVDVQGDFVLDKNKTFKHPFGQVPCVILSATEETGSKLRLSSVNDITELAKDYARDKSVLTIYKFQKGVPIHYRYGQPKQKSEAGINKTGNSPGANVDGKGISYKGDVSDVYYVPIPKDGQPVLGDKIAGFVSPDLETWKQYKEDLRDAELLIEDTIWGTDKTHQSEFGNETATGRYIDIQPITNKLNSYSDTVEYVYNTFANWTLNFVDQTKTKDEKLYHRSFGRRYIIESPDVLLDKYGKAKEQGDNNTILDKLMEEIILSKYKSDPYMQSLMLKKMEVEPYIHLSVTEVNDMFGKIEANKKVLFPKFWQQADTDKHAEELEKEFEEYFNTNNLIKNESSTIEMSPAKG